MPATTHTADITLIENSTAGNSPKVFRDQRVRIETEDDTLVQSVDGHLSIGRHPSKIVWFGGDLKNLDQVTNVTVVAGGTVLIDAEINTTFEGPRLVSGGVTFNVL